MTPRLTARDRDPRARALEAFRLLMLEHGYRRVKIQNVLDRARIGRATFYTHFRCKEDLLAASVAGLGGHLEAAWNARRAVGATEPLGFARPFFHHAAASRRMLAVLAEDGTDVLLREHLQRMLAGLVRKDLALRAPGQAGVPEDALVHYLVGALWSVLMWWGKVPRIPPDEVADAFVRLATPTLDAACAPAAGTGKLVRDAHPRAATRSRVDGRR